MVVVASQVCELDIIFNFEKAYFILDEFLLGGEAQETSKKNVLKAIEQADLLQEVRMFLYQQSDTDNSTTMIKAVCEMSDIWGEKCSLDISIGQSDKQIYDILENSNSPIIRCF